MKKVYNPRGRPCLECCKKSTVIFGGNFYLKMFSIKAKLTKITDSEILFQI